MARLTQIAAGFGVAASLVLASSAAHATSWFAYTDVVSDVYGQGDDVGDYLEMSFIDVAVSQYKREAGDATAGSAYHSKVEDSRASYTMDASSMVDGLGCQRASPMCAPGRGPARPRGLVRAPGALPIALERCIVGFHRPAMGESRSQSSA